MTRLPSRRDLEEIGPSNRHATLDVFARDIRREIDGVKSSEIRLEQGLTKKGELAKLRARLNRVYAVAAEFGDYVGQPAEITG